ncbi:MAG: hypothetical protein A2W25_10225 [candidate division Zixibacteria bacterium RBG_16_53_22]|nr:MAG: hypothetical protein A2W25_10225 [candidate division Zixibacteria bacterium RBG_16_53_22]
MTSFLDRIYNFSPAIVQNLMVTGYGLKMYRREYGRKFREKLDEFEKTQWYSESELRDYQAERLRALLEHCYENIPYYRRVMDDLKLTPRDFKGLDDLQKIPILTREDVKKNFRQLIARNYKPSDLILGRTSGTTGSPLEFYWDRQACVVKNVVDWRQKGWGGIHFGDKMAFALGRVVVPTKQRKPPFWRINLAMRHLYLSSLHMSKDNLKAYLDKLAKFAPVALEGYPSTMHLLAHYLRGQKLKFLVKAVFTSSEALFPKQREMIEDAFECKVFDFYGMAERVIFATECSEHTGHHINMDYGITEFIKDDSQESSNGGFARIVATGLHNYAMPLIRYQTSDLSEPRKGKCPCGRNFPLMDDVTTRVEDLILTRDGRYISSQILSHPFKPIKNIIESQVIQEDIDRLHIKIVREKQYNDDDTKALLEGLAIRVGPEMKFDIEFVDSVPRTAAGKVKFVISKVTAGDQIKL